MGIRMLAAAAAVKHSTNQQAAASFVTVDLDIGQREQEMVDLQLSAGVHELSHSTCLVARLQRHNKVMLQMSIELHVNENFLHKIQFVMSCVTDPSLAIRNLLLHFARVVDDAKCMWSRTSVSVRGHTTVCLSTHTTARTLM